MTLVAQAGGGAVGTLDTFPFASRLGNVATSTVAYLGKAFRPTRLAVFYPHPGRSIDPVAVALALLVLAALTAAVWVLRRRSPYLGAGWLWYAVALAPVSGLVQVGGQSMADRYTYLPLIGCAIALVWGIDDLTRRLPRRGLVLWPAALALLAALVMTTRGATAWWKSDLTLFGRAVAVTEGNWTAELNLGKALEGQGRTAEAMARYAAAVRAKPRWYLANYNLANLLYGQGRYADAVHFYRQAIDSRPGFAPSWSNLGNALGLLGRLDEALDAFREAIRLDPRDAYARNGFGVVLMSLGRLQEARESLLLALELKPDHPEARDNLAAVEEALRGGGKR
jgi:tetratricopeptide (TPR) repeat protein